MFKKVKQTYSKKIKSVPNFASYVSLFSSEDAFDRLVEKNDAQLKSKNLSTVKYEKPKFFHKNANVWRAHNETSANFSVSETEDSSLLFKDVEDKYQLSLISTKGLKKSTKSCRIKSSRNKIKKKKYKKKVLHIFSGKTTPTTPTPALKVKKVICFSTPVSAGKAAITELTFSPILDNFKTDSLTTNPKETVNVQPPRLSDVLLQFDMLQLQTPIKGNRDSLQDSGKIDTKEDPNPETNYIPLIPGKKWQRSLLKLTNTERCENRGLRQGRKSCTAALIAALTTNCSQSVPRPEESLYKNILDSSVVSSQIVETNQNPDHIYKLSQSQIDLKFRLRNPFMKRSTILKRPRQLSGIQEVKTPHQNQCEYDYKEVKTCRVSSNSDDITFKSEFITEEGRINADLKSKNDCDVLSTVDRLHVPSQNESVSDVENSDLLKFNLKRISTRRKTYFEEPVEAKKDNIHILPHSEFVPDTDSSDRTKHSFTKRISTGGLVYYDKSLTNKDFSVNIPHSEQISDSNIRDCPTFSHSNRISVRSKKYSNKLLSMKGESGYVPSPNELASESDRSEFNFSNHISLKTSPVHLNITGDPQLHTMFEEDIISSQTSDNSLENSEHITESLEDVTSISFTKSSRTSNSPEEFKGFDISNVPSVVDVLHEVASRLDDKFIESCYFDNNNSTRKNIVIDKSATEEQTGVNLKRDTLQERKISFFEPPSKNITAQEIKESSVTELNPSEFAVMNETLDQFENTNVSESFQNYLINRNVTNRRKLRRAQNFEGIQGLLTEFAVENIDSDIQEQLKETDFDHNVIYRKESELILDQVLFSSNEEKLEKDDDISEQDLDVGSQSERSCNSQTSIGVQNTSSMTSLSDEEKLEKDDDISQQDLDGDPLSERSCNSQTSIGVKNTSSMTSPNFDDGERNNDTDNFPIENDLILSLQENEAISDREDFKSWVSKPSVITLIEETVCSTEAGESNFYSDFDEIESEHSECTEECKRNSFLESKLGLSVMWPCDENEVAFRCVLYRCAQHALVNFMDAFPDEELKNSEKVGEGVYGEVFLVQRSPTDPEDSVIKIIPVQGDQVVNGEVQKTYSEIISELIISQELSLLRDSDNCFTDNFCKVKKLWCLQGKYPCRLQELWDKYDKFRGSENDSPKMFKQDQQYIVLELGHGGEALGNYRFSSAKQAVSVFLQTSFALAVGEVSLEFEHRDLHWGNVLVKKTKDKYTKFIVEGEHYYIPTYGVKATIIDYTLSRMFYAGSVNFNDLSMDPDMFKGTGDYQFDIYRIMKQLLCNDWSRYVPETNIKWLDYMVDKLIKEACYRNQKSKVHLKFLAMLEDLRNVMADFESAYDYVEYLGNVYKTTTDIIEMHDVS